MVILQQNWMAFYEISPNLKSHPKNRAVQTIYWWRTYIIYKCHGGRFWDLSMINEVEHAKDISISAIGMATKVYVLMEHTGPKDHCETMKRNLTKPIHLIVAKHYN